MPSVLIEVGFMSNPDDLAVLRSAEGRDEIAANIFRAFCVFKARYDNSMDVQHPAAVEAQQKAAAEQELAKIMQNAKTERTKIAADASVKKTEAVADATQAAYLSGSPVYQSAATVTGADKEWADAEALAASILFN